MARTVIVTAGPTKKGAAFRELRDAVVIREEELAGSDLSFDELDCLTKMLGVYREAAYKLVHNTVPRGSVVTIQISITSSPLGGWSGMLSIDSSPGD